MLPIWNGFSQDLGQRTCRHVDLADNVMARPIDTALFRRNRRVESLVVVDVKTQRLFYACDCNLEIGIARAQPLECLHRSRSGINIEAGPALEIKNVCIGEPRGMMCSDIHVESMYELFEKAL